MKRWLVVLSLGLLLLSGCYERGVVPDPNEPVPHLDFSDLKDPIRTAVRQELKGEPVTDTSALMGPDAIDPEAGFPLRSIPPEGP